MKPSTVRKKPRVTPTTVSAADSARTSGPAASIIKHTSRTPSKPSKERDADGGSLTDRLAANLFGDEDHSSQKPTSSSSLPSRDLPSSSNAPNEPLAAAAASSHAPQQSEDQQHLSHMQPPRHEGYYGPHHPAPYSDPYRGYYAPPEYPPSSWNVGPGSGWYPPGHSNAALPGAPMGAQHPPPPSYDVVATETRAPPLPASPAPPAISPPPPFPVPDTNAVTTTYPISNSDSAPSALLPPIPMGWGTSAFFLLSAMWAFMKRRSTVVGNPYASAMSEQTSKLSDD